MVATCKAMCYFSEMPCTFYVYYDARRLCYLGSLHNRHAPILSTNDPFFSSRQRVYRVDGTYSD